MRVAAISDTHGAPFEPPLAEVFVHAGDMTGWGQWQEVRRVVAQVSRRPLNMENPGYRRVILVPGNHDRDLENAATQALAEPETHVRFLVDEALEYQGKLFYGSPWTLPFYNWAFMRTEEELARLYRGMPDEIDVLITHGPAYGILDDGKGSKALREAIEKRKVRYHVFGHIHECGGMTKVFLGAEAERRHFNVAALSVEMRGKTRLARVFEV